MDDRFENLIHKRDLKLAVILLGLFCVMVLTVSRLAYWIGRFPSTNLMRHSAYLVIGMLIGVACCLGGIQLFVARVDEQVLGPIAICCGCSFLAGLLGVLPAVMFLCSSRRNYLAWSLVLNLIGSQFFTGAIVGAIGLMGAWISLQDALSILEGSLAATATFSIGIGIIRLFGFRLAKHFDAPILK